MLDVPGELMLDDLMLDGLMLDGLMLDHLMLFVAHDPMHRTAHGRTSSVPRRFIPFISTS